ncbi:MAG: hydrogenase expression/formation protein HypE [Candidatus Hydrogenedentes bacterium]|nr:hydrogenase expression/formation protein HypE [Candidatus Hydrogenedentota bacterium]
MSTPDAFSLSCPIPHASSPVITMAHGGGGTAMHRLIEDVFYQAFQNPVLAQRHDASRLDVAGARLAFTTDSYVVQPLEFPGGDIASLAVHGTVNDLAMAGARPLCLSAGFILEEGFSIETLRRLTASMRRAADACRVCIATGDTKVIERRGAGDGLFINTAGIGVIEHDRVIGPAEVRQGDTILVNGDLGRHGIAVMAVREGLEFETAIESDSAPVAHAVLGLLDAGIEVHCLRDLTRGGLVSAANEIAQAAGVGLHFRETDIPVRDDVRGACELLGFDPLYVANEGRFMAIIRAEDAPRALELLRDHPQAPQPAVIGEVRAETPGRVTLESRIGAQRILDMLSGEQLPRIC